MNWTKTVPLGSALALMFLSLGAGCTAPNLPSFSVFPQDLPSGDIDLAVGSTLSLEQTSLNPLERLKKQPQRVMTIANWTPNQNVELSWDETFERETAASIAARSEAERATGVGEESHVPEPVYETVSLQGSIKSDALNDGQRIFLPSEWQEREVDLGGSSSTVIWLSKAQYDELAATRHTKLSLSVFDQGLQQVADGIDLLKDLLAKAQGESIAAGGDEDPTEIVAGADWGSYTLKFNHEKVSVQTIQAENKFASYTILANPDNPLILEVELKAWAYGTEAIGLVTDDLKMSGYAVTEIYSNLPSQ